MKNRPIAQMYANAEKLKYSSMPQYYIEGYQSGCYYELYVNGILVFKHYKNVGLSNHAVPINDDILKSGPQQVTIKLYPLGEVDGQTFTTIDPDDSFRLKIFSRDKKKSYKAFDYEFYRNTLRILKPVYLILKKPLRLMQKFLMSWKAGAILRT